MRCEATPVEEVMTRVGVISLSGIAQREQGTAVTDTLRQVTEREARRA